MTRATRVLFTIFTTVALAACGGDDSTGPTGGGGGGGDGGGGDGGGGSAVVEIRMQNIAFVGPGGGDAVTVTVGTPVEWVNLDNVQHTATSTSTPTGGASFDSGLMGNGDRFRFTPQVAGTWTYFCEVHPGIMLGATITATEPGTGTSTDDPPSNPDDPGDSGYGAVPGR